MRLGRAECDPKPFFQVFDRQIESVSDSDLLLVLRQWFTVESAHEAKALHALFPSASTRIFGLLGLRTRIR
jgi:hypothetical protein